jgi:hypothetical protein
MAQTTFAVGLIAVLAATAGCRMGAHPYDNCGPVWSEGACKTCNPDYRAGSIISGGARGAMPGATESPPTRPGRSSVSGGARGAMPGLIADSAADPSPTKAPARATRPIAAKNAARAVQPDEPIPPTPSNTAETSGQNTRPAPPGTREGTTNVLSVEDRKVEQTAAPAADEPAADEPETPQPRTSPRAVRPSRTVRW